MIKLRYIFICVIFFIVVVTIKKIFFVRNNIEFQQKILSLSYESNKKTLKANKSLLIISDQIEQHWNDSIKYILLDRSGQYLDFFYRDSVNYTLTNTLIIKCLSANKDLELNNTKNGNVIIDETTLFNFVFTDDNNINILLIKRIRKNQFEIKSLI